MQLIFFITRQFPKFYVKEIVCVFFFIQMNSWCSIFTSAVLHAVSCYTEPRYNEIRLHYAQLYITIKYGNENEKSMVSCQKGPTYHA